MYSMDEDCLVPASRLQSLMEAQNNLQQVAGQLSREKDQVALLSGELCELVTMAKRETEALRRVEDRIRELEEVQRHSVVTQGVSTETTDGDMMNQGEPGAQY